MAEAAAPIPGDFNVPPPENEAARADPTIELLNTWPRECVRFFRDLLVFGAVLSVGIVIISAAFYRELVPPVQIIAAALGLDDSFEDRMLSAGPDGGPDGSGVPQEPWKAVVPSVTVALMQTWLLIVFVLQLFQLPVRVFLQSQLSAINKQRLSIAQLKQQARDVFSSQLWRANQRGGTCGIWLCAIGVPIVYFSSAAWGPIFGPDEDFVATTADDSATVGGDGGSIPDYGRLFNAVLWYSSSPGFSPVRTWRVVASVMTLMAARIVFSFLFFYYSFVFDNVADGMMGLGALLPPNSKAASQETISERVKFFEWPEEEEVEEEGEVDDNDDGAGAGVGAGVVADEAARVEAVPTVEPAYESEEQSQASADDAAPTPSPPDSQTNETVEATSRPRAGTKASAAAALSGLTVEIPPPPAPSSADTTHTYTPTSTSPSPLPIPIPPATPDEGEGLRRRHAAIREAVEGDILARRPHSTTAADAGHMAGLLLGSDAASGASGAATPSEITAHHHHHHHHHHHTAAAAGVRPLTSRRRLKAHPLLTHPHTPTQCGICLGDFEGKDKVAQLPCSPLHILHHDCLVPWLKKARTCPLCTTDLEDGPVVKE